MARYIEFINTKNDIDNSHLDRLESLTGYKLPADFRQHYLLFNGGEPEYYLFLYQGDPLVVQEFFPVMFGEARSTVEGHYKTLVLDDGVIPNYLLPFGRDPGGDFYCLDMENGRIVVFRAEYLPNMKECITCVAGSMSEFLNGLTDGK